MSFLRFRAFALSLRSFIVFSAAGAAFAFAANAPAAAKTSGIDQAGMNKSAVPGDDFYGYANGTWLATAEIPADRGSWGAGAILLEDTNKRLAALIEDAAKKGAAATPAERMAGDFYSAFMDEAAIEQRGLAPLQSRLQRIAALKDKTALARLLGEFLRADVDPINSTNFFTENLFGLWVAQGFDDPTHYNAYLLQGGLGMPDRAYYVTENDRMQKLRDTYRAHIATVLRLGGVADADAKAARIFALELKLAQAHATREDSEEVQKANNPWTRADFPTKAPGMDWAAFFAGAQLERQPRFIVWHPTAITGASALAASEPLDVWQDYLVFHTLNQFSSVLPKTFADARFAFYGHALSGTPQQQVRWKRALAAADDAIGDIVGQIYVAKYFPPSSKARAQEMVANLVRAFDARIARLEWMAPATKAQARAKLKSLYVGVGYPERWKDYTGLVIDRADAAGNLLRAEEFHYRQRVALLGGPVEAKEWSMAPQEVNAVNMPMQNALNFPAAILQPPFFDPAAPDAVNYGSIGSVIGHEISHSFDDQGAQFDAQGRLRDWWTPDDLAHFKTATAALVAQYSAYKPFPDLAVNGQQTLSENLADLAGLAAAYDGYRAAAASKPAPRESEFTSDQLFFIAFAQSWREKEREATLRRGIITDGHSPDQYRALTVRNLDPWYAAFAVQPGQALYLDPAARVRVW
ncbi:MAG TPA: M13 family metallopeptidase [Opitutaceae bacterium]|nr:M13 family metallopeptidase [Opitutaceae bacterium]